MAYVFKDKGEAYELKRIAQKSLGNTGGPIVPTGNEVVVVKAPAAGIVAMEGTEITSGLCTRMFLNTSIDPIEVTERTEFELDVFNTTDEDIVGNSYFQAARCGVSWISVAGGGGGGEVAPKRVKFKLNAPLWNATAGFSGSATATVVDSMNSGLSIGSSIQVKDYQKQFEFTQTGSVGIAVQSNLASTGVLWHVETCTQLVTRMEINLSGDLEPWDALGGVPAATIVRSMSAYPDVLWAVHNIDEGGETLRTVSEGIGANVDELRNPLGLVAASGTAVVERRPIQAQTQDEDNQVLPYTVSVQAWYWAIVSVTNEVSNWARTTYNQSGEEWELNVDANSDHAGGVSPLDMDRFANGRASNPPQKLWNAFLAAGRGCHVASNEEGWAFLNKSLGEYTTVMSSSALYGLGEVLDVVGNLESENSELIKAGVECGKFQYKNLTNVVAFGTSGSTSTCQMKLDPQPDPVVDVFENANDVTVVTGTEINATTGELEFTTKSIKACDTTSSNLTLPYTTQDVITDLDCGADSLEKSYRTIKFIGSSTGGSDQVSLPCTNPDNYDWQYIFDNHIYNETWWNVSYYDITWPTGCDPCPDPLGCCTGGSYDGQDVTEDDCTLGGGTWSSSPCSGGSPCEGDTVSGFSIGGFATTGCSATFTQTGTATISGGTATINGDWAGLANNFPVGSVAGTFTFTTDGTNHSASGTLPSNWGGGTVSVSDTGTCTGTYQGSATLTGGNFPCGGMINGTYDFSLA